MKRRGVAVLVGIAMVMGLGLTASRSANASAGVSSGRIADSFIDGLIHADQLQLIARGPNEAVATAQARLDRSTLTLRGDRAALAGDTDMARHAGRIQATARANLDRDTSALSGAVVAHRRAGAAVATARRQLQALAVGWYTGGASVSPSPAEPLSASQTAGNADTELSLVTRITGAALRGDVKHDDLTARRVTTATKAVGDAHAVLVDDVRVADNAAVILSGARRVVRADGAAVGLASAALDARQSARSRLIASFDRAQGGGPDPVPTILGPSVMTAAELTAWFQGSGDVAETSATIQQLTSWYISEGRAEGVRGDIAFAQAVVETGAFDSLDAVTRNNYAGIGHCDSCGAGLLFSSPLAGIRSQIQLLRTYADATLTSADLPSPPPLPSLAPERQAVRGCCRTWNSLTGVWATDPEYGTAVLGVYIEMLSFAVSHPGPSPAG